ncbi:hypothetical protein [Brevibacillus migulae]|uniref:hypothetical protein n=1 Tax=Brevibacillus migulae TaxID=1644114 RepID=UPI00106EC587|nr:hypothetical protein [Brevibacillus migulae]
MAGTIAVNITLGIIAFVITMVTALSGNVFLVSIERAVYAFLLFFLLGYPIRWVTGMILSSPAEKEPAGSQIDLVTPDDSEGDSAQKEEEELKEAFTPFTATRIERKDEETDPTNIANVIRRLTDD